jgi:O-antigen/teichoic acid export membrane protein
MSGIFNKLSSVEESLKVQAVLLGIGRIVSLAASILIPILLVRLITKEEYGYYQLVMAISLFVIPVLGAGLNSSLYYFFPALVEYKNKLIQQTVFMLLVLGTVAIIVSLILLPFLGFSYSEMGPAMLLSYFMFISSTSEHLFILEKKAKLNALFLITQSIVRTAVIISAAIYLDSIKWLIIALSCVYLLRTVFIFSYIKNHYSGLFSSLEIPLIKKQLRYSLPFCVGVIFGQTHRTVGKFIIPYLLNVSQLAVYAIGTFQLPIISLLYNSINNVAIPKLAEYFSNDDRKSAHQLLLKVISTNSMFTIPIVIFAELVADTFIIVLFTEEYSESIIVFRILIANLFFEMSTKGLICRASGIIKVQLYITLIGLVIVLPLGWILTKEYGITGMAAAMLLSQGIVYLIFYVIEARILRISFLQRFPIKHIFSYLFGSAVASLPTYYIYTRSIGLLGSHFPGFINKQIPDFMGSYYFNELTDLLLLVVCAVVYFSIIISYLITTKHLQLFRNKAIAN